MLMVMVRAVIVLLLQGGVNTRSLLLMQMMERESDEELVSCADFDKLTLISVRFCLSQRNLTCPPSVLTHAHTLHPPPGTPRFIHVPTVFV